MSVLRQSQMEHFQIRWMSDLLFRNSFLPLLQHNQHCTHCYIHRYFHYCNNYYYTNTNKYYTRGIADGLAKVNVTYVYHQHEGTSSTKGGCYTNPVYHSHTSSCYSPCPGLRVYVAHIDNGECKYQCSVCGTIRYLGGGLKKYHNTPCDISTVTCGISTSTIVGYSLGCNKTENTIEQAIINYQLLKMISADSTEDSVFPQPTE